MMENGTVEKSIDELFDDGVDMTSWMADGTGSFPGHPVDSRCVSLNMPAWLIDELDSAAGRLAVPRQSVVIFWLAERAE